MDLVWFDISDPERPELEGRVENAFRYALPTIENGYGFDYNMCYSEEARAKGVVVGWEPKEREETIYHYPSYGGDLMANDAAPGTSTQGVNGASKATRASPVSPARLPVFLSSTAQNVKPCSS